ncbi:hypothetical protein Q5752_002409 [Cryptotrichosporon argae]
MLGAGVKAFVLALAAAVQPALAYSTIYTPILSPTADLPWVINATNLFAWRMAGSTGIVSFDLQLHNPNKTIMNGFLDIALRVPNERLSTGYKNYGGEIEVDLDDTTPTGDGFVLVLLDSLHGQVYSISPMFSIYASAPANYSTVTGLPSATVTATLSQTPNPTQDWAITMDGEDPDATATTTAEAVAGDAGGQRRSWF